MTDDWKKDATILSLTTDMSWRDIAKSVGKPKSTVSDYLRGDTYLDIDRGEFMARGETKGPRMLVFDIETAPVLGNVWQLFQQNVSLNMIERDWYCLSWSAKWLGEDEIMYEDKRGSWDDEDDSELIKGIWKLLDEADILISQNGKRFDVKKLNARFIQNGMKPPSTYRHVDTLQEAKRNFGFTSNKLEYMTDKLCKRYKKLKHGKFPGFELWKQCLAGNMEAWDELEEYNSYDVLSLEELYNIMLPWMRHHPNINVYHDENEVLCKCGGDTFTHSGYHYTNLSKYNKFSCDACGTEVRDRVNLLSKEKRASLMANAA